MKAGRVTVIGAGLAGSEAAWQISQAGIEVDLFEMRPVQKTEAHQTEKCAELVCSNSLGSTSPTSASRQLKEEVRSLGGLLLKLAEQHAVPAGESLAIDREKFSSAVTEVLESSPRVRLHRGEVTSIPEGICVLATGPLTSKALSESLSGLVGSESLYFYDAISPIVAGESLDREKIYAKNRYNKGTSSDFLNIPLTKEEYDAFIDELLKGDVVLPHDFEEEKYFEGCLPIETIASRGRLTLAFGPMKPVGLEDPRTEKRPYAVIQLRAENRHLTAYNLVGFQTKLKYGEQVRVFRKLPGLENAEFLRLGSMHRNTYLDSPRLLMPTLQLRKRPEVFVGGQLTGTEGYLESIATGLLAGKNAARLTQGLAPFQLPETSMLGALLGSITNPEKTHFQPTNVNFGLFPPIESKGKKEKRIAMLSRATENLNAWKKLTGAGLEATQS